MFSQNSTIAPFLQYTLYFLILSFVGLAAYYLIYIGNKFVNKEDQLQFRWRKIFQFILLVVIITIIVALYKKYSILGNATFAVFISVLLAFLLNPIVNKLESIGIKRGYGIILSYLGIVAILVFLGFAIIPGLIDQATKLITNLPHTINTLTTNIDELLMSWNIDSESLKKIQASVNGYLIDFAKNIPDWTTATISTLQGSVSTMITMVLIPIITYYFIKDKDQIIRKVFRFIPKHARDDAVYLYHEINFAMREFIISRSLMAVFIGFATGVMLWIFGIPFAFVIGVLTMLMDIVPYIGPVIATAPALIFALIQSPMTFVWVAFFSWFLQWIEQNVVGPKLFSSSSGLHEVLILISIIVGGGIFGVWGMILAVPAVVIVKIFIEYFLKKVRGEKLEFTKDIEKKAEQEELERQKKAKKKERQKIAKEIKNKFTNKKD